MPIQLVTVVSQLVPSAMVVDVHTGHVTPSTMHMDPCRLWQTLLLHPLRNIPPSPTQWDIPQIQPTMAHFITPWRHPNYKCESVCVWYMDVLLTACCCFKKVLVLVCSCLYLLFESWRKGKDSLSILSACCCFQKIFVLVCACAWAGLFLFVLAISILVKKGLDSGSCDHMLSYDKK